MSFFKASGQKLKRFYFWVERLKFLSSLRSGLMMLIPFLIAGAFASALHNFPVTVVRNFIQTCLNGYPDLALLYIYDATLGLSGFLLLITCTYQYASSLRPGKPYIQLLCCANAAVCFFSSFGLVRGHFELSYLGTAGIFYAILISFGATRLFLLLQNVIRFNKNYSVGANEAFNVSMSALFAFIVCALLFSILNVALLAFTGIDNINELFSIAVKYPFDKIGKNLGSAVLCIFLVQFLWMFGIHGGNALNETIVKVFGEDFVSGEIFSKAFFDAYVNLGGAGATVCLLIALIIFSRRRSDKNLAYGAAGPALLNINEPLVFGLPVVFNPVMFLPFITVPLVFLLTAYGATALGLVKVVELNETIGWTTPVFLSGYKAAGWGGVALQAVNVALGVLIYWPFVKLSERLQKSRSEEALETLKKAYAEERAGGKPVQILQLPGDAGSMARLLAINLKHAMRKKEIMLFYQPFMNGAKKAAGAEALLRWKFNGVFQPPDLLIRIAEEDGAEEEINNYIFDRFMADMEELRSHIYDVMKVSFNINPTMFSNERFMEKVLSGIKAAENGRLMLNIEITENSALKGNNVSEAVSRFNEAGVGLSIDDFSMGSTSIKYLQSYKFDNVKLDGELVRDFALNENSGEIVSSVIKLGKKLGFTTTAEYVENQEIFDKLKKLGCTYFQGWYFSKAVPLAEFIDDFVGASPKP